MDIFKLFFEHDLRLDDLAEPNTADKPNTGPSIEDFMRPDPTYSKFYFTGTRLQEERFGLSVLEHYREIAGLLEEVFGEYRFATAGGGRTSLTDALESITIGEVILLSRNQKCPVAPSTLHVGSDSNVGHIKRELSEVLEKEIKVLYKEKALHGFDLHLFSRENIYEQFFYPLKELVEDTFRFFSINSKRVRSERTFYFETWTLENPPHGVEEVLRETVL